jgi:hypothetical protein
MTRSIDPGDGAAIGLDALIDTLETTAFHAHDEDSIAALGPLLARLGRNRGFLADLAIAELKSRCAGQSALNGYGAQSFLLHPANGRYLLRANFWPAADDAIVHASGPDPFAYGMAHDHNFPFLTYGYLGPGYRSDYWERDPARPDLPLRFTGRRQLLPGQVQLYRMQRDVHAQLPPEQFSVTLNILVIPPEQRWIDQHRFDPATGAVTGILSTTPAEGLVAIAAHLGGGNGVDLVDQLARRHPHPRMRATARAALDSAAAGVADSCRPDPAPPPDPAIPDISRADKGGATRSNPGRGPGDSVRSRDTSA